METLWLGGENPVVRWGDGLTSAILQSIKDFAEALENPPPKGSPHWEGGLGGRNVEIFPVRASLGAIFVRSTKNLWRNSFHQCLGMLRVCSRGMTYRLFYASLPTLPKLDSYKLRRWGRQGNGLRPQIRTGYLCVCTSTRWIIWFPHYKGKFKWLVHGQRRMKAYLGTENKTMGRACPDFLSTLRRKNWGTKHVRI